MSARGQLSHFTRWTGLVVSICVADSIAFSYDLSPMGSLGVMPAYCRYFKLNTALISTNIAMALVGGIVVALVAGPIIYCKGRRFGILAACFTQIVGAVLQGAAQHIAMFIVGMKAFLKAQLPTNLDYKVDFLLVAALVSQGLLALAMLPRPSHLKSARSVSASSSHAGRSELLLPRESAM